MSSKKVFIFWRSLNSGCFIIFIFPPKYRRSSGSIESHVGRKRKVPMHGEYDVPIPFSFPGHFFCNWTKRSPDKPIIQYIHHFFDIRRIKPFRYIEYSFSTLPLSVTMMATAVVSSNGTIENRFTACSDVSGPKKD